MKIKNIKKWRAEKKKKKEKTTLIMTAITGTLG